MLVRFLPSSTCLGGVPNFVHRCAWTRDLFDLIVELRPSSTSGAIAERIRRKSACHISGNLVPVFGLLPELHLLEYQRCALEYLESFQRERSKPKTVAAYFGKGDLRPATFSPFAHSHGYAGRSITDEMVSEVYLSFVSRTRQQESELYLRTLTGRELLFFRLGRIVEGLHSRCPISGLWFTRQHIPNFQQGRADGQGLPAL